MTPWARAIEEHVALLQKKLHARTAHGLQLRRQELDEELVRR
jgi:hypothetical protein